MKMYLFPGYVSLSSVKSSSPNLCSHLEQKKITLEEYHWDGTLSSLPTKPALVRASSVMECKWDALTAACRKLGHFCFYDDQFVGSGTDLIAELEKWLEKNGDEKMEPAMVIPYLKSSAADRSTLGAATHAQRQAAMLLGLWKENVIKDDVQPSTKVSGHYPIMELGEVEDKESFAGRMGFDIQGLTRLKEQLAADANQVAGLPIEHPDSQSFYHKLQCGLQSNLFALETAVGVTELKTSIGARMGFGPELFLSTFQSRHNTDASRIACREIMNVMLPILIEKLVIAGYADSKEDIEWSYEESPKAMGLSIISQFKI
jgi:hypothetical protein